MARAVAVLRARLGRRAENFEHVGFRDALYDASRLADLGIVGVVYDARLQAGAETARWEVIGAYLHGRLDAEALRHVEDVLEQRLAQPSAHEVFGVANGDRAEHFLGVAGSED